MKKITNEEINKIISDINPNFVSHLMEESWGYSYNWYKRNDYKYYMDHDLKNAVWMKKSLK